jgi:hypothetical protein
MREEVSVKMLLRHIGATSNAMNDLRCVLGRTGCRGLSGRRRRLLQSEHCRMCQDQVAFQANGAKQ